jgi:uncharacterized protein (DUF2141 family)
MFRRKWSWLAIWATAAGVYAQEVRTVTIAGEVRGATQTHTVHVALWAERGFLAQPVQEICIEAGHDTHFRFAVAPGRWAISAYEDRNENGLLDMGLFGPKEPSGFWRPFRGKHRPHFDEVAVAVDRDSADIVVTLR